VIPTLFKPTFNLYFFKRNFKPELYYKLKSR
jgi:hypothetical protein